MIYSQQFSRRKEREIPKPSIVPIMLLSAVLLICTLFIMQPIKTGINIDLPKVNTDLFEIYDDFQYANVQIRKDGLIFINGRPIAVKDIENMLKNVLQISNDARIFVHADKSISYGDIAVLLNYLNNLGYSDIALVGKYNHNK
ncbi:MAG: biopolymer transporter ExbD [Rickettsiales bacterium]|nr:biopolymer transporter ExbD [Rickettsiales bacterium]